MLELAAHGAASCAQPPLGPSRPAPPPPAAVGSATLGGSAGDGIRTALACTAIAAFPDWNGIPVPAAAAPAAPPVSAAALDGARAAHAAPVFGLGCRSGAVDGRTSCLTPNIAGVTCSLALDWLSCSASRDAARGEGRAEPGRLVAGALPGRLSDVVLLWPNALALRGLAAADDEGL